MICNEVINVLEKKLAKDGISVHGIKTGSEMGDELSFERKSTWMGTCDKMKMCFKGATSWTEWTRIGVLSMDDNSNR